ncbi:MAG: radical SAM protein, partial [Anaerolineae bacterium]
MLSIFQSAPAPPAPGLYHYLRQTPQEKTRIHLRIDPDGHGTLMVNASRVVHLNPTAAFMAYLHLEETPRSQAVRALRRAYRVSNAQANSDYAQFRADLEAILHPEACLFCTLDNLEIGAPFSERPNAPYRMDLALTYRCNNDCAHCYNVSDRHDPELDTAAWKAILDRLWEIGIPHIVFTGGEPTLR